MHRSISESDASRGRKRLDMGLLSLCDYSKIRKIAKFQT